MHVSYKYDICKSLFNESTYDKKNIVPCKTLPLATNNNNLIMLK